MKDENIDKKINKSTAVAVCEISAVPKQYALHKTQFEKFYIQILILYNNQYKISGTFFTFPWCYGNYHLALEGKGGNKINNLSKKITIKKLIHILQTIS